MLLLNIRSLKVAVAFHDSGTTTRCPHIHFSKWISRTALFARYHFHWLSTLLFRPHLRFSGGFVFSSRARMRACECVIISWSIRFDFFFARATVSSEPNVNIRCELCLRIVSLPNGRGSSSFMRCEIRGPFCQQFEAIVLAFKTPQKCAPNNLSPNSNRSVRK